MKKIFLMLIFVSILLTGCTSEKEISNLGEILLVFGKQYSENDKFIIDTYEKVLTETLTLEEWEQYFNDKGYLLVDVESENNFGKYTSYHVYFPSEDSTSSADTGLMRFSFYEIDDSISDNSKYVELYILPADEELDYTIDTELAKIRKKKGYILRNSNSSETSSIWSKGTYEEQSIGRGVSLLASKSVEDYSEFDYALIRDSHLGTELYSDKDINANLIVNQILDVLNNDLTEQTLLKYMNKYNTEPRVLDIGQDNSYIWGNSYDNIEATVGLPVNYWELKYVKYGYLIRVNGLYQLSSREPEKFIDRLFNEIYEKYDVELKDNVIIFNDLNFNKNIDSLSLEFKIVQNCIKLNLDIYLNK